MIAYPGSKSCFASLPCNPDFDSEPVYSACHQGSRKITYRWGSNINCNIKSASLPAEKTIQCSICEPGYYLKDSENGVCDVCPLGYFSNNPNSNKCERCPAGKYAPRVERYENLETWPNSFETRCEITKGVFEDLCSFTKGWIIAKNKFAVPPNLPGGTKVILVKRFNATQEYDSVKFAYSSYDGSDKNPGNFKLKIDGETKSICLLI